MVKGKLRIPTHIQPRLYHGRLGSDGGHESTLDIVLCIHIGVEGHVPSVRHVSALRMKV